MSSDNPAVTVSASILNEGAAAPVQPGEVVGLTSINSVLDNSTMSGLLVPLETLKSVPLFSVVIGWPIGYSGTGTITGDLEIGSLTRQFRIDLELGPFPSPILLVSSAQRVGTNKQSVYQTATGDIPIPVYDPIFGILEHVQLDITLNAGTLNIGDGQHSHNHATAFLAEITSTDGPHSHPGFALGGSANGIAVNFNPSPISVAPSHQHVVFFLGTVTSTEGGHFHSYGSTVSSLTFSTGELAPFLGSSDFLIPVGDAFGVIPPHLHCFGFSCGVPTSPHEHVHTSTGSWSTLTAFTFAPASIPGLTPWGLAALAATLIATARRASR